MPFTIHITRDYDQMSAVGAQLAEAVIAKQQAESDSFVLGLATGSTPSGTYKHLAKAFNAGRLDARSVRTFNLDEYVGLPGPNAQQRMLHAESYSYYMVREFFSLLTPGFAETNVPWATLIDEPRLEEAMRTGGGFELLGTDKGHAVAIAPDTEGYLGWIRDEILAAYEAAIVAAGGIDLHIIGVGGRGHVAFHECGIPFEDARMLLVQLDDDTITNAVADGHFADEAEAPHFAVSMGAELVFNARQVHVLASGARKTGPITEAVLGEVTADVPLSLAHLYAGDGGDVSFVLDEVAARGLLEAPEQVAARGITIVDHRDEPYEPLSALAFAWSPETNALM